MSPSRMAPDQIVVIGNGMVGHRLCELLVERGLHERYRICVFGAEPVIAYDRIHLGALLEQNTETSQGALSSHEWYREHDIELLLDDPVQSVDLANSLVTARSHRTRSYRYLVFATGARPRLPNTEGVDEGVLVYRTRNDVAKLRAVARPGQRVAILGGGLLGLECADSLRGRGCTVTVHEASQTLLPRQLDGESANVLRGLIERRGIRIETGYRLLGVSRTTEGGYSLQAVGRAPAVADVLVAAIGVRPEDSLARAAGVHCAPAGGIAVDETLTTSDQHVFAVGDCAAFRGVSPGLVAPGYEMAEILTARLAGDKDRLYEGPQSDCRLKVAGVEVVALGRYELEASHRRYLTAQVARTLVLDANRLVGATVVGRWEEHPQLQRAVSDEITMSARELSRFERRGTLGLAARALPVVQWRRSTVVCQCTRVTRGALSDLVERGARDVDSLRARSGAGSVCGSCVPLLGSLCGTPRTAARLPYARLTGTSSALLFVGVASMVLLPALPSAASVRQASFALDTLLRSSAFRQTTGFAILAFSLLGLLLSARKRLRWPRVGSFGGFRALHTSLGLLSIGLLSVHTGLSLGTRLNFALALTFILAALVGASAGVATVFERDETRTWVRGLRAMLARIHVWLLWPLPALLAFHIIAAYYF